MSPSNIFVLEMGIFVGFLLGIALGIFLVKNTYGIEIFTLLLKTPIILAKAPGKLTTRLKVWQEFRIRAKVQKINRRKKIEGLNQKVQKLKQEIKSIKAEIRQIKWLAKEPQKLSNKDQSY